MNRILVNILGYLARGTHELFENKYYNFNKTGIWLYNARHKLADAFKCDA